MSFDNISFSKLAIIFIIAGVALVLAILGSSATSLFSEKYNRRGRSENEAGR